MMGAVNGMVDVVRLVFWLAVFGVGSAVARRRAERAASRGPAGDVRGAVPR